MHKGGSLRLEIVSQFKRKLLHYDMINNIMNEKFIQCKSNTCTPSVQKCNFG